MSTVTGQLALPMLKVITDAKATLELPEMADTVLAQALWRESRNTVAEQGKAV